ncbi:ParB family protein [Aquisalimonas asiatica]|uniref:Integrating conjugative element, PFGI_1 class, ParB family protein n=1 Tax=Aquisalimonas asiatica TaxID=406100 RepID=A0A1H8T0W8_9GAMM|nr:ParB family protein [Aquisalimonas asiatica]SEO84234.1 integrating conjugative element, PFGI_1 class, ParB family protein [Aquisalimonas asiatica]
MAKEIDRNKLRQTLYQGHFGQSGRELEPGEPVTVTQMVLDIDQVKAYDRNPRRKVNPRYSEIKASIRAQRGLNNALEITRRPGDDLYMIRAGGNTRLQILRELHEETGDDAFRRIHCLYHPWQDDAQVLVGHLVENELRGEMTLIDKAVGLEELRAEFESEAGERLSRSEFQRRLEEVGYTVSRRLLIRFEYAATQLLPAIPEALGAGLSGGAVEDLRRLHQVIADLWTEHGYDDELLEPLWTQALQATDGPDWDVSIGREELERELATALDLPLRQVRMELETRLQRNRADGPREPKVADQPPPKQGSEEQAERNVSDDTDHGIGPAPAAPESTGSKEPIVASNDTSSGTENARETPSPSTSPSPALSTDDPEPTPLSDNHDKPEANANVGELRERSHAIAQRVARRYRLDIYMSTWDRGMGFLMDLPPPEDILREPQDPQQTRRGWVWWLLVVWSEAMDDNKSHATFPDRFELGRMLHENNHRAVHYRVGYPYLTTAATEFFSHPETPDTDFEDLMALMRICRQLARTAQRQGMDIWRDRT